jgi:CHAT domain-containing protein/Tfp pilus assembly protein PilF
MHRPRYGLTVFLLAVPVLQPGWPAGAESVPSAATEQTIEEGETRAYQLRLAAGDFLRVAVEQEAVDVEVQLLAPDGRQVALVDGPGPENDFGTEDLAAVADTGGLYQVRVRAGLKNAPVGRFRIRLEPPHPAGADDLRRVAAVRANQEATNGMAAPEPMPPRRQAELRETARGIWRALGEKGREADTLLQLGLVRSNLGETGEAASLLHQAAALYGELGDRVGQAKALNEAGRLCERSGHLDEALGEYRKAASLAQEAGARWSQVNALNNLGNLLNHQGQPREAIALLAEAQKLGDGLHCDDCQANILVNLGSAHHSLFEPQIAIDLYKKALSLPSIKPEDKAGAYNNLGLAYHSLGNREDALASFEKADAIIRNPSTLCNLGITLESLGRLDEALASYRDAVSLSRQSPQDVQVRAKALHSLGYLYLRMARQDEALAAWDEVGTLTADRAELAPLRLFTQAAAQRARGDRAAAARDLELSLNLSRERNDLRWATMSALDLARVERESGHLDAALGHLRFAVATIESQRNQVLNPDQRALFLGSRQRYYEQYVDTLMELDAREPGRGWNAQALEVSEGARARSLLDLLGEVRSDLRQGVNPALLHQEEDLRAAINAQDEQRLELIHQGAGAASVEQASARLDESLSRFAEVEAELRRSSPVYAALTQPQPLNTAAIQSQVLADGVVLLEYSLGEERSFLWIATPSAVRSFTLPGRGEIEKAALAFYDAVSRKDAKEAEVDKTGRALSRMILGPAETLLGDNTLLVVGDGVLQYIPFSALPSPSTPRERLLDRHRLVSLPSASTLAILRQELAGRPAAPKTLAVLADPIFRSDPRAVHAQRAGDRLAARGGRSQRSQRSQPRRRGLPGRGGAGRDEGAGVDLLTLERLPFSQEEARAISRLVADKEQKLVALQYDASPETAKSGRLAAYRYVHFATHGILDTEHPGLSKLVLSQVAPDGQPRDGSLRLQDIYNLQLNADLVVLSACRTALGKEIRGEGLLGLTRGFMYAGSARVLASLWSVEDRATWKLMEKVYRHLLIDKLPAAESLRLAQLEMARQGALPYYWAGFSLQGEWR